LTEDDSSQSLVTTERGETPKPSRLYPYQNQGLFSPGISLYTEPRELLSVCNISSSHADYLLNQWTSLPQFERRLQEEESEQRKQRQQAQQATVESDSEEGEIRASKISGGMPGRSDELGGTRPLFTENNLPSPESDKRFGPSAPPTPADIPHTSNTNLPSASPRTSIGSLPVEAAAAVEAKEEDDEVDLEIPWKLCTRRYYWRYIDAKQVSSNTDQAPSIAFLERNSWTEIMASWVCKEAIQEARLPFTQVQKERKDSRRTKFETCFCIERPLQFDQVKRLVERTVEIYRKNTPPTPPTQPKARTSSFHRQQQPPPPPSPLAQKSKPIDRDRTPVARNTHPPLHRARSSMTFIPPPPPAGPPPLDRSTSTAGPSLAPKPSQANLNPRTPNLQIPIPPVQQYAQHHLNPQPQSPRHPYYPAQTNGYPSHPPNSSAIPPYYPQSPAQNIYPPYPTTPTPMSQPHPSYNNHNHTHPIQASPLRPSYMPAFPTGYPAPNRRHDDDTTTSDSELEPPPRRSRRDRDERSRQRYTDRYGDGGGKYTSSSSGGKKSSHHTGRKAAAGALLGVGGLTALLDGLSGL
jgi:hypothetical protein